MGANPLSLWEKLIIWQAFCRKLHENENWTKGKERAFLTPPPPDPPMTLGPPNSSHKILDYCVLDVEEQLGC